MTFPRVKDLIALGLAVLGLLGFASLYLTVIWSVWGGARASPPQTFNPAESIKHVGIAFAGLVGGYVAAAFGQPYEQTEPAASPRLSARLNRYWRAFARRAAWVVSWSPRDRQSATLRLSSSLSAQEWLGVAYIIVYFTIGAAALVTWMLVPNVVGSVPMPVPDMIKSQGLLTLGLLVAIAGTLMKGQR